MDGDKQNDAADKNPQSFSAMNAGRPVSSSQKQHGSSSGGHFAVILDGVKPPSVGDLAKAHKVISGTGGKSPYYQDDKIPSLGDIRQIKGSSSNPGGYSNTSRPISYNSDHFPRH